MLFWIPVFGKKGGQNHKKFGTVYAYLMLVTATMALGMGTNTILAPVDTHSHLTDWPPSRVQGIFGWMMLYLSILTISLVWHGLVTVRNKRQHLENRRWPNVGLNFLVIAAAFLCAYRGWLINEVLMMGIAVVGVGSGISVYTAFMAFGFVRLMPHNALNPKMWSIPLVVGLAIIIYHQTRIRLTQRRPARMTTQGA